MECLESLERPKQLQYYVHRAEGRRTTPVSLRMSTESKEQAGFREKRGQMPFPNNSKTPDNVAPDTNVIRM
ncbi:hypothetical protein CHS0354_030504 [Potamilus streckersoni]|uniref:Uncharacterized protein n=1 Tax=Potamilus streckersoni TaxID=2493646 RepID=A0AAE0VGM5_9BIVA|nr:hypothetical protein CHS0354_030504 [Potamilus streckersoni]